MRHNFIRITACRVCGNRNLVRIVDLGEQYLTGVFPKVVNEEIVVCGNFGDAAIGCGLLEIMENVHPHLLEIFQNLRLRVLGRNMPSDMLVRVRKATNIEYYSWIENFDDFIGEADVVLVPDMAGAPGAKTRVVQAMALGAVVVGTRTAFEGIPLTSGIQGVIYDSAEECALALINLLGNMADRHRIGLAAATLAANEYSLDRVGPMYEAIYVSAVEKHRRLNVHHHG